MFNQKPIMGWNSWNTFGLDVNEKIVIEAADALIETGLADCGYEYIIIDDNWQLPERDANGRLVPNPEKFPHGIKYVSDYVHSKGLKFGLYSCSGTFTCACKPGSFNHEFEDAEQFAEWEIDYLKYDNCQRPMTIANHLVFRRMAMALRNSGRNIVFAGCTWGANATFDWAKNAGLDTFRSTADINDSWESISSIAKSQFEKTPYNGAFCYNDMDMLVVGIQGNGIFSVKDGCTWDEYQTHFALWALMASPLIIGCDMTKMAPEAREILMNKDLIAINQDPEGRPPYCLKCHPHAEFYSIAKPLSDGSYAIGLFNFSDSDYPAPNKINVKFWDFGLPVNYGFDMYDVLNHKHIGICREYVTAPLRAHQCAVYVGRPVKL